MKMREGTAADYPILLEIWEASVRATHLFLTEADIAALRPLVRDAALPNLELWVACDAGSVPRAFAGLSGDQLEALFVSPAFFRRGIGSALLRHARDLKGPLTVDVNEQNPQAVAFYEAHGFEITGRSPVDSAGRPFPLLHLQDRGPRP